MNPDLAALQGTWRVTALEVDGNAMPANAIHTARVVVDGSRFTSTGMTDRYEGTVELGVSDPLKTFDLVFIAGPEAGNRNLGIYRLDGDTWTLCLATRGTTRPALFATYPGSGIALETLQRDASAKAGRRPADGATGSAARPARSESASIATELEGEWEMVSAVFGGAPMDPKMVAYCKRITHGDVTTVMAGPQVQMEVRFTIDTSRTPHAIEYVNIKGANAGRQQSGIYELTGDILRVCVAAPTGRRPDAFESRSGDGRSYTTWRRA